MKLKSSRGIVMKLICCTALVVLSSAVAFSATPTSGAFLTIDGTAGTTAVHIKLYDSQIHSGVVQAVPTCITADQVPTDAYVLQGGSATGCDPGDAFEVTDDNTSTSKQTFGTVDISGFHIETHYKSQPVVSITGATNNGDGTTTYNYTPARGAGLVANETIVISGMTAGGNNGTFTITAVTGTSFTVSNSSGVNASGENGTGMASVLVCNTSGSICAAPDTGFITVTNGTGSAFTGTISLKGVSPVGGGFCPAGGIASDSSNDLAIGSSVTLALSTDSSNCGGFNQSQRLTLNSNVTASATFGADDYQITPLNATNLLIDVLPVPVPSGFTESITYPTVFNSSLFFDPGTNFSGQKCVAISDFSAVKNPVCLRGVPVARQERPCVKRDSCGAIRAFDLADIRHLGQRSHQSHPVRKYKRYWLHRALGGCPDNSDPVPR